MPKLEKRIQELRQQPRGISGDELGRTLESPGFVERRGKGSHKCYTHSGLPGVILTVPRQNPLLPTFVEQAVKAIEKLTELENHGE